MTADDKEQQSGEATSSKASRPMARLWQLTAGRRGLYAAAFAALIIGTLFAYAPPLVIKVTIDAVMAVTPKGDARIVDAQSPAERPSFLGDWLQWFGGPRALADHLWIAGVLVLVLTVCSGLFAYLHRRLAAIASETITRGLRDHLYAHLQHLPCSYFDKAETGDLVQRCTSDVETVRLFLSVQVVELVKASVMIAVAVPIMLMLDWRMAVAAVLLLPVILTFAVVFFIKVKTSYEAMDDAEGVLSSTIQENLTGIRVVRAFARQDFEHGKFARCNMDHRRKHMHHYAVMGAYWASSDLLVFGQLGLVLFAGAYLVQLGEAGGGISVGTLVAFWSYVGLYIWPVRQMGRILADLGRAAVAVKRLDAILREPEEGQGEAQVTMSEADLPEKLAGRIVFDHVSFSHGQASPVLDDVSFTIEPGQTLAILGPSGSGKSTIVNLLLRFYDYDAGSITLDGMELRRLPRKYVRAQVGSVMQEPFLFSKSVRENIRIGDPRTTHNEGDDQHMIEAAAAAAIHASIVQFNEGYDTLVGERGVTLSGGQRQRVALARALIRHAPVLILDDAFSAVDTRTESAILDALRKRHGRQSTILIAHRLSTLMQADAVLVLERGRVTDLGTHDELVHREGLYRKLWELQGGATDEVA